MAHSRSVSVLTILCVVTAATWVAGPQLAIADDVTTHWTQIGPAPLRVNWLDFFQGEGPDSGTVLDIAVDPRGTTDQVLYIATLGGGIWKSTDAGLSWAPKTDSMPSLSTGAVAVDPANALIVYAGTGNVFSQLFEVGEGFNNTVGLYKSTDGGDTWTVLNPNSMFDAIAINRIVLPISGLLLVATDHGLFRSVDSGLQFGSNPPSYNNGEPILAGVISDLDLDTERADTVYASVAGVGIFRSTDRGVTFPTNLFDHPGAPLLPYDFVVFAQSTAPNHLRMYASVGGATVWSFAGLFRSDDAGATWTQKPDATIPGTNCQCGYDQTIGVDPQDADRVYIGFQRLWDSTDGGNTFADGVSTNMLEIHVDHHALTFSPPAHVSGGAPTRFYVGTDGGIARTDDGTVSWTNLNEGIATNLFYSVDIGRGSAVNNGYTYGSTQDTGTVVRRPGMAGTDWDYGIGGDSIGNPAVDPCNPSHAFAVAQWQYVATTDGGANWTVGTSGLPQYVLQTAADPNCGVRYVASSTQLFRSTDAGATFGLVHTFPAVVETIATVQLDSNILWVGLDDGTLQHTEDALAGAAATWFQHTVTGAPAQPVSGVAINPVDANEVVVVYPGFCGSSCLPGNRTRHAFRTATNGGSWSDISGTDGGTPALNLPDLPLHAVVVDPGTVPPSIVVASDAGVMRSTDLGATWHDLGTGLPRVLAASLALDWHAAPPLLRVGTYGRSVFELTTTVGETPACGRVRVIPPWGGTFWGTTTGKNTLTGTCGGAGPETVFQWTPPASGEATIETCGAGTQYDTVVFVRSSSCVGGGELACDDDGCANLASAITTRVSGGTTYFIVVDSYRQGGAFTLSVSGPPAPATPTRTPTPTPTPQACASPTVIPAGGGVFAGTTAGADTLGGSCGGQDAPETVFQWTPGVSGIATIETCGPGTAIDTVLYVRRGDCLTGPEMACDNNTCPNASGFDVASRVTPWVLAGETYFIVVDGRARPGGAFTLTVIAPQAASPTPTATPTPAATAVIRGHVRYYSSALPVSDVEVRVFGPTPRVTSSDSDGLFTVAGLTPGSYTVDSQKQGGLGGGVSALDASYVLQSVVGLRTLTTQQQLAGDVTGNGSVSALDASRILQHVVGLMPRFPVATTCGSDWAFVPVPAVVPNQALIPPQMLPGFCQHGAIGYTPLTGLADNQDFHGVLFGDCTGNWEPSPGAAASADGAAASPDVVRLGRVRVGRSGVVRVPLVVDGIGTFDALQVRLAYDPARLTPLGVRPTTRGATVLAASHEERPGLLAIALASGRPLGSGMVLTVHFERRRGRDATGALAVRASVVECSDGRQPTKRVPVRIVRTNGVLDLREYYRMYPHSRENRCRTDMPPRRGGAVGGVSRRLGHRLPHPDLLY